MSSVIGVDIGGTKTAAAVVGPDGRLGRLHTAPTRAAAGPDAVLDGVRRLVADVRHEAARDGWGAPGAVGIATAGMVDTGSGVIAGANETFPGWPGTPVKARLTQDLGVAVTVLNDARAHAIGEAWAGAAAGVPSALVVAIGTGVGGAVVFDGQVLGGAHHAAGEMGHMPSAGAGELRCPCGRVGHLEAVACGPAIAEQFRFQDPGRPAGTPEVLRLADAGNENAVAVVRRAGTALGQAIAGVVTVVDPHVVVLGGGVAGASAVWWDAVCETLRTELVAPLRDIPVRLSTLGGNAPLIGAARSAWRVVAGADDLPNRGSREDQ
ncbi:ROK family protein [Ruania halotolerans]|uniref:ROK family protein n=1 Tax=Ruania halotolerans TaxID=2897773 RepID=UPI001E4E7B00|nr:ROK family protein [Ruania halotolerans]UFU06471.1 ROK family protein [Ruania halotolerans]